MQCVLLIEEVLARNARYLQNLCHIVHLYRTQRPLPHWYRVVHVASIVIALQWLSGRKTTINHKNYQKWQSLCTKFITNIKYASFHLIIHIIAFIVRVIIQDNVCVYISLFIISSFDPSWTMDWKYKIIDMFPLNSKIHYTS